MSSKFTVRLAVREDMEDLRVMIEVRILYLLGILARDYANFVDAGTGCVREDGWPNAIDCGRYSKDGFHEIVQ